MGVKKKTRKKPEVAWDAILPRIVYLCDLVFGGNTKALAKRLDVPHRYLKKSLLRHRGTRISLVVKLVRSGLANAEWLLTGTGPVRPCDHKLPVDLPPPTGTSFPLFDTQQVQYQLPEEIEPEAPPVLGPGYQPAAADIEIARLVYAARKHDKPVMLFLNAAAIVDDVGAVVVSMMKKGYVTGIALSSEAAERDLERALYGGWATPSGRVDSFNTLLNAAEIAASNGLGWGLSAGRWCFPPESDREASVIASAYELGLPVTIHLVLGDCVSHLFPSRDAAVRGAALGAASYLDLLVFAEQVRKFATLPNPGLYLNTSVDSHGGRLVESAIEAATGTLTADLPVSAITNIGEEYRHTFPALLAACDAVYDGSADDGR